MTFKNNQIIILLSVLLKNTILVACVICEICLMRTNRGTNMKLQSDECNQILRETHYKFVISYFSISVFFVSGLILVPINIMAEPKIMLNPITKGA